VAAEEGRGGWLLLLLPRVRRSEHRSQRHGELQLEKEPLLLIELLYPQRVHEVMPRQRGNGSHHCRMKISQRKKYPKSDAERYVLPTGAQILGGVCMRHGAKLKLCSSDGCTNQFYRGGVCMRHGAKLKLYSSEGCSNQAKNGGVRKRHTKRNP